jgi:phenylalanine-4-hydroxylase
MDWWEKSRDPKIYGAGLLSSVGESQSCLSAKVKKIPLTVDCVYQSYDITEPQPQLFVTPTLEHLVDVLEDLEKRLAFRTGGEHALKICQQAQTVNTVELDSGLQISGQVENFLVESKDQVSFFKLGGPVQLCLAAEQLHGHGRDRRPTGFSSPIGRWKAMPERIAHVATTR